MQIKVAAALTIGFGGWAVLSALALVASPADNSGESMGAAMAVLNLVGALVLVIPSALVLLVVLRERRRLSAIGAGGDQP